MAKKADRPRDMANDIIGLVRAGTKKWTTTRKAEERSPTTRAYRYSRMTRERGISVKEAAAQIMEAAYLRVSGPDRLPANARQIMYAARDHIQKMTGRPLESNYFTQTILPNYVTETGVDWNVVYDARGHFNEPHGGTGFGIGTLEVQNYLANFRNPSVVAAGLSKASVVLSGPKGNFGAVLFIEKEGFDPLLKAAKTANKFDIAIMSTKGMSVVAARALADEMCHEHDIPLLLLHDFDKGRLLDRRDDSARHAPLRISEQHYDDRSRPESQRCRGDGVAKRTPAPSEGRQGRADGQPARERRERGRGSLHVSGL
jgi:hypothetical protein